MAFVACGGRGERAEEGRLRSERREREGGKEGGR